MIENILHAVHKIGFWGFVFFGLTSIALKLAGYSSEDHALNVVNDGAVSLGMMAVGLKLAISTRKSRLATIGEGK